jgi:WD40 repeat protein
LQLTLERIIGTTTLHNSNLAVNNNTGEIAYAAGCAIVIYNPAKNAQTQFLLQANKSKPVTCLAFSPSGKYLAAGEVRNSHDEFCLLFAAN